MGLKKLRIIQFSIIIASLVLIVVGIFNDEAKIVFQKAIFICLECIGIG